MSSNSVVATEKDIRFDCPHCGQSLAVEASAAGQVVPCPKCTTSIQIPAPGEIDPHLADLVHAWRDRARHLDDEVKRLREEREQIRAEFRAAEKRVARATIREALRTPGSKMDELISQLASTAKELGQAREQRTHFQNENTQLADELARTRTDLETCQKQLQTLRVERAQVIGHDHQTVREMSKTREQLSIARFERERLLDEFKKLRVKLKATQSARDEIAAELALAKSQRMSFGLALH